MKKLIRFLSYVSAVFAIGALVLILATPCVYSLVSKTYGSVRTSYQGILGIFGGSGSVTIVTTVGANSSSVTSNIDDMASGTGGLIAFILLIVGILGGVGAGLLGRNKKQAGLSKLLGFVTCLVLVAAGVLIFCEVSMFYKANNGNNLSFISDISTFHLEAGWIIAGIVAIVGGLIALCPIFVKQGKKK